MLVVYPHALHTSSRNHTGKARKGFTVDVVHWLFIRRIVVKAGLCDQYAAEGFGYLKIPEGILCES